MDNLYENLENYDDANIIHDLKNENKDLKIKIDQYSSAMVQLQKDFDNLSSEYKKLERNYSSLLKTAKAEIERKTQMITNLNKEKDMLVISALQTKGPEYLKKIKKNIHNSMNSACDSRESLGKRERRNLPGDHLGKQEQLDDVNSMTGVKAPVKNETKENVPDKETNNEVKKIMNRRKSMPASGLLEYEDNKYGLKSEEENIINPLRNQRGNDLECTDRRSNRTSDTSSVDNRYSYNGQTSREPRYRNYYDRVRQTDEDYRTNDRYEQHWQGRYQCSERNSRHRDIDRKFDSDHRSDRQPYSRYKRNKSRDRRSHYSNEYHESEVPNRNFEKQPVKHKRQSHSDEPSHKKIRVDSYGEYLNQGITERDYDENPSSLISPDDPYRCQSPDHANAGYNEQHFVKEIMHTSATQLEDPRITSKKYVLRTENNKSVLSTVSKHYMDIKPVDKSLWQLPRIAVPDALLHKPVTSKSSDLLSEVYRNVDSIVELNASVDSGEIPTIEDEALLPLKDDKTNNGPRNKDVKESFKEQQQDNKYSASEKPSNLTTKYKIPKLDKTVQNQDTLKALDTGTNKETCKKEWKDHIPLDLLDMPSQSAQITSVENVCLLKTATSKPASKDNIYNECTYDKQHTIGTIENDLLLSDDASDNMDLLKPKQTEEKSLRKKPKDESISDIKINEKSLDDTNKKSDNVPDYSKKDIETTDITNGKKEGSGNKTKKIKKKLETKSKDPVKDTVTKDTKKGKENKVSEIKSKFSDLFGESSSLIMPEDLGLNAPAVATAIKSDKFESIFDDTQSAVDLQLKQKEIESKEENIDTACKEKVPSPPHETETGKGNGNDNNPAKIHHFKDDDSNMNLYENLNAEVSMDGPHVVIISTGVQPNHANVNCDNSNMKNVTSKSFLPALKALATSTPLKINVEPTTNNDHLVDNTSQSSNNIDSLTNSNTVGQGNEPDVPDVRIFVKRRRKVKKT